MSDNSAIENSGYSVATMTIPRFRLDLQDLSSVRCPQSFIDVVTTYRAFIWKLCSPWPCSDCAAAIISRTHVKRCIYYSVTYIPAIIGKTISLSISDATYTPMQLILRHIWYPYIHLSSFVECGDMQMSPVKMTQAIFTSNTCNMECCTCAQVNFSLCICSHHRLLHVTSHMKGSNLLQVTVKGL